MHLAYKLFYNKKQNAISSRVTDAKKIIPYRGKILKGNPHGKTLSNLYRVRRHLDICTFPHRIYTEISYFTNRSGFHIIQPVKIGSTKLSRYPMTTATGLNRSMHFTPIV